MWCSARRPRACSASPCSCSRRGVCPRAAGGPRWRAWSPGSCCVVIAGTFRPGPYDPPFAAVEPVRLGGSRAVFDAVDFAGWILVLAGSWPAPRRWSSAGAVRALPNAASSSSCWPSARSPRPQRRRDGDVARLAARAPPAADGRARPLLLACSRSRPGLAILRRGLYGIDVAINRTLVYGSLTPLLAAAFAATTLLLGTALGRGSPWTTAGATLVVAVASGRCGAHAGRRRPALQPRPLRRAAAHGRFLEELRAGRAAPEAIEPLLRELVVGPEPRAALLLPESGSTSTRAARPCRSPRDDARTPADRAGRAAPGAGAARAAAAPSVRCSSASSRRAAWRSRSHGCAWSCAVSSPRSRPRVRGS